MGATQHTTRNPSQRRPALIRSLKRGAARLRAQGAFGFATLVSVAIIIGFVIFPTIEILAKSFGMDGNP